MNGPFGVVILSAGASRRMGSPKALLPWGDATVLEHLTGVWKAAGATQIAVVHNPRDETIIAEMDRLEIADRIANPDADEGMMSSIRAASRWEGWKVESIAVALVDQPWITVELVRALADFGTGGIRQPVHGGRRGHPVFFSKEIFLRITEADDGTLKDFIHRHPSERAFLPWSDDGMLKDMDTPEDYRRAIGEL